MEGCLTGLLCRLLLHATGATAVASLPVGIGPIVDGHISMKSMETGMAVKAHLTRIANARKICRRHARSHPPPS